jgi:anti-sigma factor RsiW
MSAPDRTDHERWSGDAAAYVLGALDSAELECFEAHLSECAACREAVAHLQVVADALPAAAPPMNPAGELKDRIMATVRAEAELLQAAGPASDRVSSSRRRSRRRGPHLWGMTLTPATGLASLVLLAAGAAVGGLAFGGGGGTTSHTAAARIDPIVAPGARAFVRRSGNSAQLHVMGLPAPPRGRIWQVWIKQPRSAPEPSVRFELGSGVVNVPGNLRGGQVLMVTDEPIAHVSDVPTGQVVIRALLV